MSRHSVECREPEKFLCVVGWDGPLETFFAQVVDRQSLDKGERDKEAAETEYDHKNIVLWRGTGAGELPTVGDLSAAIRVWAQATPGAGVRAGRGAGRESETDPAPAADERVVCPGRPANVSGGRRFGGGAAPAASPLY